MPIEDKNADMERLIERYEKSLSEGHPGYYDVDELEDLSEYYLTQGKQKESGAVIEMGLKLHPNNSTLLLKRVTLFVEVGDYQRALHILERLPEKENADALLLRAEIYFHTNRKQEGISILRQLMQEEVSDRPQLCLDITSLLSEMSCPNKCSLYLSEE